MGAKKITRLEFQFDAQLDIALEIFRSYVMQLWRAAAGSWVCTTTDWCDVVDAGAT